MTWILDIWYLRALLYAFSVSHLTQKRENIFICTLNGDSAKSVLLGLFLIVDFSHGHLHFLNQSINQSIDWAPPFTRQQARVGSKNNNVLYICQRPLWQRKALSTQSHFLLFEKDEWKIDSIPSLHLFTQAQRKIVTCSRSPREWAWKPDIGCHSQRGKLSGHRGLSRHRPR